MNDDILESSVKVIEYTGREVSAEKQLMYKSKLPYVKTFFLPGILAVSWVFQNLHGFSQSAKSRRKKSSPFRRVFTKRRQNARLHQPCSQASAGTRSSCNKIFIPGFIGHVSDRKMFLFSFFVIQSIEVYTKKAKYSC